MEKGLDTKKLEELLTALKSSTSVSPYALTSYRKENEANSGVAGFYSSSSLFAQPGKELSEPEQTDQRVSAVADALEQLERAKSVAGTIAICCQAIVEPFRVARMAVGLRHDCGTRFEVTGVWDLEEDLGVIPAEAARIFLPGPDGKRTVPFDERMQSLLPSLQASYCTCLPLSSQDQMLGFLLIIDTELRSGDVKLLSMVAHAAAAKLSRIVKEAEQARAKSLSDKVIALANTLLLVDNRQELYESILCIACDLVDATQGSIMLVDETREDIEIAYTRGMSLDASDAAPVKIGRGIAGMVAQNGEPLLVNDVEKDHRFGIANRPRFKSKSLLCVPLKLKERVMGVLNLSEKKNLAPFTNGDLHILSSFANLASVMIERTQVLEKSIRYEQLSVTDPLTGLYNRRFLKSRLEEELNRSTRQGLDLTVLFIDLDYFKSYNDICGHIAGDKALRKTADIIKGSLREMDIVARYGGEEFCALLPGTSKEEAMLVAERIRGEIENERFPGESELCFRRITTSIGVASFPEDGRTFTALVHASDVALYHAKASGRNRVAVASPTGSECITPRSFDTEPPPSSAAKTLDFNSYLEASIRSKG